MKVEIDSESGFCYGVIRAVEKAERNLSMQDTLYSLGSIVHNNSELERLNKIGLTIIDVNKMKELKNTTVLIRAHGEPPCTYKIAEENNISLIDCTCPVVLKLQAKIRETYNKGGAQIVIFGKKGHAEVNGLIGQVNSDAIIVDKIKEGDNYIYSGLNNICLKHPIHIFSQTTKDPKEFSEICIKIKNLILEAGEDPNNLIINNTICTQVARRHSKLIEFAKNHSIIIFVSGEESSNGKVLYELCKSVNERSYKIQTLNQIKENWFNTNDNIGICGATSTPKWQLEQVAELISKINPLKHHQ